MIFAVSTRNRDASIESDPETETMRSKVSLARKFAKELAKD